MPLCVERPGGGEREAKHRQRFQTLVGASRPLTGRRVSKLNYTLHAASFSVFTRDPLGYKPACKCTTGYQSAAGSRILSSGVPWTQKLIFPLLRAQRFQNGPSTLFTPSVSPIVVLHALQAATNSLCLIFAFPVHLTSFSPVLSKHKRLRMSRSMLRMSRSMDRVTYDFINFVPSRCLCQSWAHLTW